MFELNFSDVKPSILNWLIVGLMAITFIAFVKFVVLKYDNSVTRMFAPLIAAV